MKRWWDELLDVAGYPLAFLAIFLFVTIMALVYALITTSFEWVVSR